MKKNQASSTAYTVLQGILYTADLPQHAGLVSDEMKAICTEILSASPAGQKRLRQLKIKPFRSLVPFMEKMTLPGITLHYVLRKRFIEEYVLKSIREGATQVINLGAGFDTIAYRLSKQYPQVNFVEVDHPATHAAKREALQASAGGRENLHFIPVDFTTQRLEDVLKESPQVKADAPTLIIVEGVLMYLNKPQVEHLFKSLPMFLKAGKRVIFSAVQPASDNHNSFGPLMKVYLKIKKEPLKWTCRKKEMAAFVNSVNCELIQLAGGQEFKQLFLPAAYRGRIHEAEYIAVAEQGWSSSK